MVSFSQAISFYQRYAPSKVTLVRHWSRFIFTGTASYGIASMALGIIQNSRIKIYAGAALFLSNLLGFYGLSDIHQLEDLVAQLNSRIRMLEEDIKELTNVKDRLEEILKVMQEEKSDYEELTVTFEAQIQAFERINENLSATCSKFPQATAIVEETHKLVENLAVVELALKLKTDTIVASREGIEETLKEIASHTALLDRKTVKYNEARELFEEERDLLDQTLSEIQEEKDRLVSQQRETERSRSELLTRMSEFMGYLAFAKECYERDVKIVGKYKEQNALLTEEVEKVQVVLQGLKKLHHIQGALGSFARPLATITSTARGKGPDSTSKLRIPTHRPPDLVRV
ncbi:MAG: hypothetical protein GWP59_02480 [Chlamydiales bacterium]|nr:hypothetical protein [Chlamydiales bacterium]